MPAMMKSLAAVAKAKPSKPHVAMMKKGMMGVKSTQKGAFVPGAHGLKKKLDYAISHANPTMGKSRKLLSPGASLAYGKLASMKTRK